MAAIATYLRPAGSKLASCSKPAFLRPVPAWRIAVLSSSRASRQFSVSVASQVKKYTHDHEWIELSDDGSVGTIGISKYAANSLGEVVYVELPVVDTECNAGDSIGAVESVKSASDIMTPVSGTVVEANAVLEDEPKTINEGPEDKGWIAKIQIKDPKELEGLMSEKDYEAFTKE